MPQSPERQAYHRAYYAQPEWQAYLKGCRSEYYKRAEVKAVRRKRAIIAKYQQTGKVAESGHTAALAIYPGVRCGAPLAHRQQPATTAFLATKLAATSKAVDSHLYRLRKESIVVRQSWGLYALAGAAPPDSKPMPTAAESDERPAPTTDAANLDNIPARTDSWTLDDIEDGVAEPNGLRSAPYREAPSEAPDDLEWADLEMPT